MMVSLTASKGFIIITRLVSKCWRQSGGGSNLSSSVMTSLVITSLVPASSASLLVSSSLKRPQITQEDLFIVAIGLEVDHGRGGAHASDGGLVKLFILKPERKR